jgi:hypothetical protein
MKTMGFPDRSGALSPAVKQSEREACHPPPSIAEVKNAWSYSFTPPIRFHVVVHNEEELV